MCLVHSEAKKTETWKFGAVKGLFQGQAKRMGSLYSKTPNPPTFFFFFLRWGGGDYRQYRVKSAGCVTFLFLCVCYFLLIELLLVPAFALPFSLGGKAAPYSLWDFTSLIRH